MTCGLIIFVIDRLKQRGQVADMNTILESVTSDWTSIVSRMEDQSEAGVKEAVHASLGALIKQRKVYYTGNKGYFLVTPDTASTSSMVNGCTPLLFGAKPGAPSSLGSKFSQLRQSLRERSSSTSSSGRAKRSPGMQTITISCWQMQMVTF